MKKCPKCNEIKPPDEWHKNSRSKDGLSSYCKACSTEKKKEDRQSRRGYYGHEVSTTIDRLRNRVLSHYRNPPICERCGYDNPVALTVDMRSRSHKNSGPTLWKWVIRHGFPDGFVILCLNCREVKRQNERQHQHLQTRCRLIARPT